VDLLCRGMPFGRVLITLSWKLRHHILWWRFSAH
jgi:hypothetical protein